MTPHDIPLVFDSNVIINHYFATFNELISFSCSTNIDKKTAFIGSSIGATVQDDASSNISIL
jgi:hypothetical protein